jgi:hypothetical protein
MYPYYGLIGYISTNASEKPAASIFRIEKSYTSTRHVVTLNRTYKGKNGRKCKCIIFLYCRAYVATLRDGVWIVNWIYWVSIQIHSITVYTLHN